MVELTAPPGDRFVVREITGYSLSGYRLSTSYSVYDLGYYCVVATFYTRDGRGLTAHTDGQDERRRAAEAKCRALNEQHRRWLHSGRWADHG